MSVLPDMASPSIISRRLTGSLWHLSLRLAFSLAGEPADGVPSIKDLGKPPGGLGMVPRWPIEGVYRG